VRAVTSVVTLIEGPTQPLLRRDEELAQEYRDILLATDHLSVFWPYRPRLVKKRRTDVPSIT
jgi:hypothetical protein